MKLNPNCIRDVLLELEKLPYQSSYTFDYLSKALPAYDEDEVAYTCFKLSEANYIKINVNAAFPLPAPQITSIYDITFSGHEFLNNIRSDSVWDDVKAVGAKIGASSISALTQISTGVISELIKKQLGL